MAVSIWSNVDVDIESSTPITAVTITAITKANPGVVTSNAHGLANGEYVLLAAQGMNEADGRVFRAANITANTYELEGENTTNHTTFSSGSGREIPFSVSLVTATGLSGAGGDFDFIDTTTIHDTVRKQIPGLASAATYTMENIWDVADAGLIALKQASDVKGQRAVRITFSNLQKVLFTGYIGCTLLPLGNAQDKVTTTVVVTMFGRPTVLAT